MSGNKDIVVGIRLTADGDQLVGEVKLSKKEVDRFGDSVEKADRKTGKFSETANRAARNVALMAAAAAGAAAAYSVKKTADFEKAISDLSAITGATGDQLQFLTDQALAFGAATTMSASQSAEAFKLVASAKPDLLENAAALSAVTRETITLAEAAGISLPQAANALGASLNQFSADADQSTRFINVLAAGAKFGASEIDQTAQALKASGVVAAQAGLSFEETNTALQLLAKGALKGSEAGTGLRGVLLKLQTQTNSQFKPSVVGLAQAIKNLRDAELDDTAQKKLFGEESIVAAKLLMKEADSVETLTRKLTGTNTAYEQARIRMDNLSGDATRLNSVIEAQAIMFGSTLTPSLRTLVQGFADVIKVEKQTAEETDKTKRNAEELALVVGQVADVLGNTAKGMALPFEIVGGAIGALAGQLAALAHGDFRQFDLIGGAFIDDMKQKLLAMSDPAISSRYENMAKKIIQSNRDMQASGSGSSSSTAGGTNQSSAPVGTTTTSPSDDLLKDAAALAEQMDTAFLDISDLTSRRYTEMYVKLVAAGGEGTQALKDLETSFATWMDEHWAANDEKIATRQAAQDERVISMQQTKFDRLAAMASDVGATEEEREINRYDRQAEQLILEEEQLREALGSRFNMEDEFRQAKEQALIIHQQNIENIEKRSQSAQEKLWAKGWTGKADVMSQVLGSMATLMQSGSRKMFEIGKAAAIAETIVSTYSSAQKSYDSLAGIPVVGPALGAVAAAAAIAGGVARVQKISSTKFGGGGSVSAGGASFSSSGGGFVASSSNQPTAVQPSYITESSQSQQPTVVHHNYYNGMFVGPRDFVRENLIPEIYDADQNGETLIVSPTGRTAQEIRDTGTFG
jgi:TP901 family phage tail tape measure protein